MSHLYNILTGAESTVRASATFAGGNIFKRAELPVDEFPDDVSVYLVAGKPKANDQVDAQKFTIHPLTVVIAFVEDYVAIDEGERDVVAERKAEYNDAIITALRLNMPNSTYPISNVYQVDYLDSDYDPSVPDEIKNSKRKDMQRLIQHWSYHVYES